MHGTRRILALLSFAALAGCVGQVDNPEATAPGFEKEVRGGRLHHAVVPSFQSPAQLDLAPLLDDRASELSSALGNLRLQDFTASRQAFPTLSGMPLTHVFLQQRVNGVPIVGAYMQMTVRPADGSTPARLLASSYHLFHSPKVDTTPVVAQAEAIDAARLALRAGAGERLVRSDLVIRDLNGHLQLVWDVGVLGHAERALVRANGTHTGRVELLNDAIDAAGDAQGYVILDGPPGGPNPATLQPLANLTVTGADGQNGTTAADGTFTSGSPDGTSLTARLSGTATVVHDYAGADVLASATASAMVHFILGQASGETVQSQLIAFYYVTKTWQFALDNGIPPGPLGAPLDVYVNEQDTCNAYYQPAGRNLNFFLTGGGCWNSAESTIIPHEYGHFIDDMFGGITEGGLSEGWGDTVNCFMLKAPETGKYLFQGGAALRTCDNDYLYPAGGYDEVHALGQAWSGFSWHVREGLIAQYGEVEGDAMARALVMPSLASNAPDIPAAVREVFLRDDDDGDLSNHTPHWTILYQAAQRHALDFVVGGDLVAPGAVNDLAATSTSATSVTLRWTAPGNDGAEGTAAAYDIRWATAPISEATFPSATQASAPDPLAAGQTQETTISLIGPGTIYIALKTRDQAGNVSSLSNVLAVDLPAPTVVYSDGAENGQGAWQATGLWHVTARRASEGSHSFWYGQEATGNYDNGVTNSGTLTSPSIDLTGVVAPKLMLAQYIDVESGTYYDNLTITVRDLGDPTHTVFVGKDDSGTTGGAFLWKTIDLSGFEGKQIAVEFFFDTVDNIYNSTEGWYVDAVKVVADSGSTEPPPPKDGKLLINEVLADPPVGYDANGDGVASTTADEFVELVNIGEGPLDLGGATLADSLLTRFTFPAGTTIPAGGAVVVFGGGVPNLPGITAFASTGLALNNTGDTVRVRSTDGAILGEMTYGSEGGTDQSLVRKVDGDETSAFVKHKTVSAKPASPGTRSDGTAWGGELPPPPDDPPPTPDPGALVINEVLADPPVGYDPSGDGTASTTADEFIELVNSGGSSIDLSGVTISDLVQVRFTFPAGTVLAAGKAVVVFGGGTPKLSLPGVTVLAAGTLALNNTGDSVSVKDTSGNLLASMSYGSEGGKDQSMVRQSDGSATAPFVLHKTLSADPASPGKKTDGSAF